MNWEVILWTSVTVGVLLCVAALIVTIISARNMKKSRDSMQVLQEQIKVGAKIMFGGGIFGTIVKINDDKMDTLRYIHFNKIYKSDAILVYVDKDNTFIDSYNIMNEILAALTYEKEIMFTQLLNVATIQRLTGHVNYVMGGFGKRFKVIRFNTITYNDFTYYTLDYAVLREEE